MVIYTGCGRKSSHGYLLFLGLARAKTFFRGLYTGRADYALGYLPQVKALETFLMAIEAKKATLVLSTATAQTLF